MKYLNRKHTVVFFAVLLLTGLIACEKLDGLQPDILAPLVKGKVKVEDVAQIRNREFTQAIPPIDLGYAENVPVDVPFTFELDHVGAYPYSFSDTISFIDVDTMDFRFIFRNSYPINVKAGTSLAFRTSADVNSDANIIFKCVITEDIPQGGSYVLDTLITDKTLPNIIYFSLDHFKSDGGDGVVFSSNPSEITFEIRLLSTYKVGVKTNRNVGISDTMEIEPLGDEGSNYDDAATGDLSIYVTNTLPMNLHFALDFYDENQVYQTSLYEGDMYMPGGTTDAEGVPVGTALEYRFDDTLNVDRIQKIRRAKYVAYRFFGDTNGYPGTEVVVNRDCALKLQIVGDLKINISKLLNF